MNQSQHTAPALVVHPLPPLDRERRSPLLAAPYADPARPRPRGARGRVVRVTHAYEYRVTDEDALLHAAAGRGWQPLPAADRADDDPRDLLGAVMALTGDPALSGTRTLEYQSSAELLGAGEDGEERAWQLTPRTADLLHTALVVLADQAYDDAKYLGDRFVREAGSGVLEVFDRLPPLTWTAGRRWRRRMARAFDDLAGDLAAGNRPNPTCTAERMALHLAVQDAPGHQADLCAEDDHHTLPVCEDDYDYARLLPPDHEVEALFHADFTGGRDLDRRADRSMGSDELAQAAWFVPFDGREVRDALRGFRR
ncbi:hypothetical protein [Streptomyces sp. NPDC047014]|uniref:hypothetical protein n=1 Tax=Streptomyces sp. NPDC047014 TaxID=3155736 RepID=UPI003400E63F